MRFISLLFTLVLIGAVLLPMVITGPAGEPIMTPDDWLPESTPELPRPAAVIYKWQDAAGNWHFGEDPPAGIDAVPHASEGEALRLGKEWRVEPPPDPAQQGPGFNVGAILSNARNAASQMEKRTQAAEEARRR